MAASAEPARSFIVSIHDVAPATRAPVEEILSDLKKAGVRVASLLVVPDYHHRGKSTEDRDFVSWLHQLHGEGYEIAIHGYFHQRPRRNGEKLREAFLTRFYTQDEGEFFDLDYEQALERICRARDEFRQAGLAPLGFIAPAWLLNVEGERAARDAEMHYTTRLGSVLDLNTGAKETSRSLVYSTRTGWRRSASLLWNAALSRRLEMCELARLGIHPPDINSPKIWEQIISIASRFAGTRKITTYRDWIGEQRANRDAS